MQGRRIIKTAATAALLRNPHNKAIQRISRSQKGQGSPVNQTAGTTSNILIKEKSGTTRRALVHHLARILTKRIGTRIQIIGTTLSIPRKGKNGVTRIILTHHGARKPIKAIGMQKQSTTTLLTSTIRTSRM